MAASFDDRLEEIESRYETVSSELASPEVAGDQERMRDLGRSFAELEAIVVPYRALREARRQADEAREMAKAEADADMASYFRDEA